MLLNFKGSNYKTENLISSLVINNSKAKFVQPNKLLIGKVKQTTNHSIQVQGVKCQHDTSYEKCLHAFALRSRPST